MKEIDLPAYPQSRYQLSQVRGIVSTGAREQTSLDVSYFGAWSASATTVKEPSSNRMAMF